MSTQGFSDPSDYQGFYDPLLSEDEEEPEQTEKCWLGSLHDGPFHMYMWNERQEVRYPVVFRQLLCESCAKNVGAWKLPEKKEETRERQQSTK